MNRMTITGPAGLVQWGYATAATLGPWSLTAEPAGGTLTAKVVSADTFKVSQQPLTFVVPRPSGSAWRWPLTRCSVDGSTLSGQVGPSEE